MMSRKLLLSPRWLVIRCRQVWTGPICPARRLARHLPAMRDCASRRQTASGPVWTAACAVSPGYRYPRPAPWDSAQGSQTCLMCILFRLRQSIGPTRCSALRSHTVDHSACHLGKPYAHRVTGGLSPSWRVHHHTGDASIRSRCIRALFQIAGSS